MTLLNRLRSLFRPSDAKPFGQASPEFQSGNIFIRPNYLNTGMVVGNHVHNFDHTTIVLQGKVHIRVTKPDGSTFEQAVTAPHHLLIKAQYRHEITGLMNNTIFWCVYSHRDPQGRITQEATGWDEGYV